MLTTLLSSFMLGDINLQGVSSQGDTNVMSVIQTVFIWVLLFAIIGSLVVKKYRGALMVLVFGGIIGVFIYGPSNIISLGDSLLKFFGLSS
ncbi:hypothetical protein P4607_12030 [Priestia megaterium]|jgi:sugar phosphate permease|uniref:hypothetical protein n=1 Tax=Priestia megaterium TaxID=1404 RepID=UPI000BF32AC9|nr:hypothetical protein [Priestia megaterium]MDI3089766.1 hypothetical protein [Priestia megaterium]MDP1471771.1 hypothetical protein [Priestia megaterium]MED3852085.1 hypothetical protein [Priestia megaterium]MED3977290.1 hypothetical protein [Priestia megaterium]NGY80523.1 hypothetical protein [Priestia megaterium]